MATFDQRGQQVHSQTNIVYQTALTGEDLDNRRRTLSRMQTVLERQLDESLHGAAWLAVGFEAKPEAVLGSFGRIIGEYGSSDPAPLSADNIVGAFDELDGELLILGDPGTGKTTALLDLGLLLVERAQDDVSLPMPIVFHLASWSNGRPPLEDWLVDELAGPAYDIPRRVAERWVDHDQILPLLDGLDEVVPEQRAACVAAINDFRSERDQRLSRLVVCCRVAEYETLPQLRLRGAIAIQRLAEEQVDGYLSSMGEQVAGLRDALRDDADLRALATTPLIVNIMVLAYQGEPASSLPSTGTPIQRRSEMLTAYVLRMFTRRRSRARYQPAETIRWLAWLGRSLFHESQPVLYLDRLGPSWLQTRGDLRAYIALDRLGSALVFGSLIGVLYGFLFSWYTVVVDGLNAALLAGLFGGTSPDQVRRELGLGRRISGSARIIGVAIALAILYAIVNSTSIIVSGYHYSLIQATSSLFSYALLFAVALSITSGPSLAARPIAMAETLGWSTRQALRAARAGGALGLVPGSVVALFSIISDHYDVAPASGFVAFLSDDIATGLRYITDARLWLALLRDWGWWWPGFVMVAAAAAVPVAVVAGLLGGLTSGEVPERARPNEGFRRSLRRALIVGVIFKLVGALITATLDGLLFTWISHPADALVALATRGWVYALVGGLAYGGYACWSHLALRFVLWRQGVMPPRYITFLEYATDRVFMRRVGSGYAFVHRLVQEHIATNERELVARVRGLAAGGRTSTG